MGYACPVCDQPQADAEHLANHLAFTALTGGDDHEAWLDEHVPDWGQLGESGLAEIVVDHASEADYPQVFEDTTGGHERHSHGHDHAGGADHAPDQRSLSAADRDVLEEARDLTEAMLDADDETADADDTDASEDETQ
ncbi:DUF5810 domain-containing protein [Halomicroarcula sp. GCM10025324]|jgi:hypothetical protein|uniref:DUF5810 domain-containing protein n=1 Tax=Haloarcula TaxID=2237 RepID=UPI0023E7E9EE|nr:DUF5810 domain-containing protein [Halomicroarcula sp. ZS-22-S1]